MKWRYVKLSEVADIERDGIASDAISTGTLYLGLEHIEAGGTILGAATVEAGDLASTKFRFSSKHVLYGKLRPYLAKIAMPDFDGICSTDIVPIMPGPRLDRSFLTHFLRQPAMVEFANSRATGANLPRLSPKALADFEIPLPPLGEQKRIAAILDQADDLRRKRQRALDRLNQLGQAIFIEMFGDPSEDRYSSRVTTIGSALDAGIIVAIQDGNHGEKHPKVSDFVSEGIPFVMANCMVDGELRLEKSYKLDPTWRKTLRVGFAKSLDVLISHKGTIGQTAVVPEDVDQLILSPQVTYYRLSRSIDPYFLQAYFNSAPFLRAMKKDSVQSTRAYIGIMRQRELPILIPALEEQIKFRSKVLKIREIRADALAAVSAHLSLFDSLQAKAFNGELTASSQNEAAA